MRIELQAKTLIRRPDATSTLKDAAQISTRERSRTSTGRLLKPMSLPLDYPSVVGAEGVEPSLAAF